MSKLPRRPEEIEVFKGKILDTALLLIIEGGFDKLSMRKIASRLGVTHATLYNYYTGKDELYFHIRLRGFEKLYPLLQEAVNTAGSLHDKMHAVSSAYIGFGLGFPDYYDIMFTNRKVPKYHDCIGTALEPIARYEKETDLKNLGVIVEGIMRSTGMELSEARYFTIRWWSGLNGIVSLLNSGLMREVEENTEELLRRYVDDLCGHFPYAGSGSQQDRRRRL